MFDLTMQIMGAEALEVSEEGIELITAPAIAVGGPGGQVVPLQLGLIRSPMSKDAARELIEKIQAAIDGVEYKPRASGDIVVAKSMAGVEDAANMEKKLKGKK